jgi:hypothetical protein
MSGYDIIKEYISYQSLPTQKEINIFKLGVYNWNQNERISGDSLSYGMFTRTDPIQYPKHSPFYSQYDSVSPIILIDTDGIKYRIDHIFWRVLTDICDGVMVKQSLTRKSPFPQSIVIDNRSEWIEQLFRLVGPDIMIGLKPQNIKPSSYISVINGSIKQFFTKTHTNITIS